MGYPGFSTPAMSSIPKVFSITIFPSLSMYTFTESSALIPAFSPTSFGIVICLFTGYFYNFHKITNYEIWYYYKSVLRYKSTTKENDLSMLRTSATIP